MYVVISVQSLTSASGDPVQAVGGLGADAPDQPQLPVAPHWQQHGQLGSPHPMA